MMPKMVLLQQNGRYVQRVSKHPRTGSHSHCPLAQQTLESCTTAAKAASTTTQRSVATKLLQAMAPRLPKTATMLVASLQPWYLVTPARPTLLSSLLTPHSLTQHLLLLSSQHAPPHLLRDSTRSRLVRELAVTLCTALLVAHHTQFQPALAASSASRYKLTHARAANPLILS